MTSQDWRGVYAPGHLDLGFIHDFRQIIKPCSHVKIFDDYRLGETEAYFRQNIEESIRGDYEISWQALMTLQADYYGMEYTYNVVSMKEAFILHWYGNRATNPQYYESEPDLGLRTYL
ncbi:MAG: hypothetical protein ACFFAS_16965 [Promethearchaeota archaeon]